MPISKTFNPKHDTIIFSSIKALSGNELKKSVLHLEFFQPLVNESGSAEAFVKVRLSRETIMDLAQHITAIEAEKPSAKEVEEAITEYNDDLPF